MHYAHLFVFLLVFILGLGRLARVLAVPYPILFVLGGLCIGFVPRLHGVTLDPNFIFSIFLPPLLYQRQALLDLRRRRLIGDDVLHKIEHELDLDEIQAH